MSFQRHVSINRALRGFFVKRLVGRAFSDQDKNRRQPPRRPAFKTRERERGWVGRETARVRDRKLSPLPSLLPTLSSLLASLRPLFSASSSERWTFTRQRSACRCAAIIAYCERKLSLGDNLSNSRTINAKFGEKATGGALFNAADKSRRADHGALLLTQRDPRSSSYVKSIFRSVSLCEAELAQYSRFVD